MRISIPKSYVCMPRPIVKDGTLSISAVQLHHIDNIRQWRNSQMDILRQSNPISYQEQVNYFERCIWPDMLSDRPKNILLTFEEEFKIIGYGGLVHIAWDHRRAEVSFLLKTSLTQNLDYYRHYFSRFLNLLIELAFQDLKLQRLFTETFDLRKHHTEVLESVGFRQEGIMRNHVYINGKYVNSLIHGYVDGLDGDVSHAK